MRDDPQTGSMKRKRYNLILVRFALARCISPIIHTLALTVRPPCYCVGCHRVLACRGSCRPIHCCVNLRRKRQATNIYKGTPKPLDGRIEMRCLIYPAAAAALSTIFVSIPAQAQLLHHRHQAYGRVSGADSGGYGSGPFWQGEPTDHLPIWRYGFYQGNDPDPFIRGQIIRDPKNGLSGRR